jgi:hypothetical protein
MAEGVEIARAGIASGRGSALLRRLAEFADQ